MSYQVCVIGGGVIGSAILQQFQLSGYSSVLIEKKKAFFSHATAKNSGLCHTGFDNDPNATPVENFCVKLGYQKLLELHQLSGLPFRQSGAILCAWSDEDEARMNDIYALAQLNRVPASMLSKEQVLELEPLLNPEVRSGILIPGESCVDPFITPLLYLIQAQRNGATVIKDDAVEEITYLTNSFERENYQWKITTKSGRVMHSHLVINCAGLFGDEIDAMGLNAAKVRKENRREFTVKPRKGQFLVFDRELVSHSILPVWNERTKGVLLSPSLYSQMIIGPTAEEQSERKFATTDEPSLKMLYDKAKFICPSITNNMIFDSYSGLRPATNIKDYIIDVNPECEWLTVAGIRSTGLTSALGVAHYVFAQWILGQSNRGKRSTQLSNVHEWTFVKAKNVIVKEAREIIMELVRSRNENGTSVEIDGEVYPVTHVLSRFSQNENKAKL